jgi:hypothetical protein
MWKEILRGFEKVFEEGEVQFKSKTKDPSLRDQLYERAFSDPGMRLQSYLDASTKAPNASASTKRKWKKVLSLG